MSLNTLFRLFFAPKYKIEHLFILLQILEEQNVFYRTSLKKIFRMFEPYFPFLFGSVMSSTAAYTGRYKKSNLLNPTNFVKYIVFALHYFATFLSFQIRCNTLLALITFHPVWTHDLSVFLTTLSESSSSYIVFIWLAAIVKPNFITLKNGSKEPWFLEHTAILIHK